MTITATGLTKAAAAAACGSKGRISARVVSSSAGPARNYYQPTADEHSAFTAGTANWQALANLVNAVLTASTPAHPTEGIPR